MPEETAAVYNGRYEIVRRLARGGMAEVYLGRDLLLDRPVALKVLAAELSRDEAFVERFRREAQAAANLSHPNVVNVYDWGEAEGSYFIVMEYVPGRTLSQLIRTEGPIPAERAAAIGADIAAALGFAHRNGVVHRDVKPGNVLISDEDQVKVTDFGIARAARASARANLTQTGAVLGTATYFSPEQAEGATVDARSDLYSLGVVLYEMVTGEPPFTGENPVSIAYKHVREQPELPRTRLATIPIAFEAIVMQAMAKRPEDRYQTAEALRADLLDFARGRPVSANPTAAVAATSVVTPPTAVGRVVSAQEVRQAGGPPRGRSGAYLALLFILLLALAALLVLLAHTLGLFGTGSGPTITVPSVVGQNAGAASTTLSNEGFKVKEKLQSNPGSSVGEVFNQAPVGGATADKGSTVTIDVAKGGTVSVPSVVGQNVNQATNTIQNAGLSVQTRNESNSASPGTVVNQSPGGGSSASRGATVTLTVSSGPQTVQVPDVTGLPQDQATQELTNQGFNVDVVSEPSTDPTIAQGDVFQTDPSAGTQEPKGSTVTVYVASGQSTTTTTSSSSSSTTSSTTPSSSTTTTLLPTSTTTPASSTTTSTTIASDSPVAGGQP